MREQKQLYFHKPAEGEIGDCFRTCVACVLDMDVEKVPHAFKDVWKPDGSCVVPEAHEIMNRWLAHLNLKFVEYPIEATREQLDLYLGHFLKDTHVLLGCNSKHGGHSVVAMNGDYIWDPSKDDSGCVGPMDDGYWWIGLLIRKG